MAAKRDLTPKQERFVQEYLVDLNGTQAAIRAGYSKHTAHVIATENLRKPKIALKVAEAMAQRAASTELTAEWIVERLVENANRAMEAEPVRDAMGNPIGIYRYEGSVANKALELLGKHLGIFLDKIQHSGPDGGPLEVAVTRQLVKVAKVVPSPASRITAGAGGNGKRNGNGNGRPQH